MSFSGCAIARPDLAPRAAIPKITQYSCLTPYVPICTLTMNRPVGLPLFWLNVFNPQFPQGSATPPLVVIVVLERGAPRPLRLLPAGPSSRKHASSILCHALRASQGAVERSHTTATRIRGFLHSRAFSAKYVATVGIRHAVVYRRQYRARRDDRLWSKAAIRLPADRLRRRRTTIRPLPATTLATATRDVGTGRRLTP